MTEKKPVILQTDDNIIVRQATSRMLQLLNFDIRQASSLEEALAIVEADKDHDIRIALVDGNLGGEETGEMFIKKLRASGRTDIVTIGNAGERDVFGANLQSQKSDGLEKLHQMITRAQELSR